jgi:hypothetical protein
MVVEHAHGLRQRRGPNAKSSLHKAHLAPDAGLQAPGASLSFAQGSHDFESLDRGIGRGDRFETAHRLDQYLELSVIGLDHVIGVITRKCVLRTLRENGPGTSRFDGSDGLLEGLVEGGFADFQASGGLTNGEARRNMRPSFTQLVGRDDGPAAALAAALACGT